MSCLDGEHVRNPLGDFGLVASDMHCVGTEPLIVSNVTLSISWVSSDIIGSVKNQCPLRGAEV
jgi:hypothetical protein